MSTDPAKMLRAQIVAHPDDIGLRRVYADVLMSRGDPRGEFIHLQCSDAPEHVERAAWLLLQHGKAWVQGLHVKSGSARFIRGFVEEWMCSAPEFIGRGNKIAAKTPLLDARISGVHASHLEHVLKLKAVQQLRALELSVQGSWPFRKLAERGAFARLERLVVKGVAPERPVTLDGMVAQPWFGRVRELELHLFLGRDVELIGRALDHLVALTVWHRVPSRSAPRLERLTVRALAFPDELGGFIARAPRLKSLQLSLPPASTEPELGDKLVERIVSAEELAAVELRGCALSEEAYDTLRRRFSSGLTGDYRVGSPMKRVIERAREWLLPSWWSQP